MISRDQIEQLGQLIQNVNPDKHYWFFRTMGGMYYDEFVSKGFIAIGYNEIIMKDLESLPDRDDQARAYIKRRLHEFGNKLTDSKAAKAAGQIVKFYRELAVGDVIKMRMAELGITQTKLAEILGLSASRISDYITGKSEPTLKVARDLAIKLEIAPAVVLGI